MDEKEYDPTDVEKTSFLPSKADPPPEEFANPAGLGGEECEIEDPTEETEPCDPSAAEDLVMGESSPGLGIFGYEGEEVGGG